MFSQDSNRKLLCVFETSIQLVTNKFKRTSTTKEEGPLASVRVRRGLRYRQTRERPMQVFDVWSPTRRVPIKETRGSFERDKKYDVENQQRRRRRRSGPATLCIQKIPFMHSEMIVRKLVYRRTKSNFFLLL